MFLIVENVRDEADPGKLEVIACLDGEGATLEDAQKLAQSRASEHWSGACYVIPVLSAHYAKD